MGGYYYSDCRCPPEQDSREETPVNPTRFSNVRSYAHIVLQLRHQLHVRPSSGGGGAEQRAAGCSVPTWLSSFKGSKLVQAKSGPANLY